MYLCIKTYLDTYKFKWTRITYLRTELVLDFFLWYTPNTWFFVVVLEQNAKGACVQHHCNKIQSHSWWPQPYKTNIMPHEYSKSSKLTEQLLNLYIRASWKRRAYVDNNSLIAVYLQTLEMSNVLFFSQNACLPLSNIHWHCFACSVGLIKLYSSFLRKFLAIYLQFCDHR
jgi:hypothetical protein